MTFKILLLVGIGVLAIYMIPPAVARFAGSHTWEVNASAGVESIECVKCHGYIRNALNATPYTEKILNAHAGAAGNQSYTQGWLNLSIDNTTTYGVCHLCHLNQLSSTSSHSKVSVRVCTDHDCHGNNATTNNTAYDAGKMGVLLGGSDESNPTNAHMRLYNQISAIDSDYSNETSDDYKKGFFLCLGCHTQADFKIVRTGVEEFSHTDINAVQRRYL